MLPKIIGDTSSKIWRSHLAYTYKTHLYISVKAMREDSEPKSIRVLGCLGIQPNCYSFAKSLSKRGYIFALAAPSIFVSFA